MECRTCRVTSLLALAMLALDGAHGAELDCVIEPSRIVNLSTAVEGVLQEIRVERGDAVKKGQVVAVLQSDVERVTVKLAKLRADMNAQVNARKVQLDSAQRKLDRSVELVAKNFVSSETLDEIRTDLEVARLNYEDAVATKQLAHTELARAKAQYELRVIASPIDGVVTERLLSEGEFAQAQKILTIARIDPLHVEVVAPIEYYGRITPGMTATVVPETPLVGRFAATVKIVDGVVDAASGSFGIRLELPNADGALPAGIECTVKFGL